MKNNKNTIKEFIAKDKVSDRDFEDLLTHIHMKKSEEIQKYNLDNSKDVEELKSIYIKEQKNAEQLANNGQVKLYVDNTEDVRA